MFDIMIDTSTFIPQTLRQKFINATVDALVVLGQSTLPDETKQHISLLPSDGVFCLAFEQALQEGADRFIEAYLDEDEDLVEAIASDEHFFGNAEVPNAFLTMLSDPDTYLAGEYEQTMASQSFDSLFPRRRNRKRVRQAVLFFLKCLATEVWNLPELRSALAHPQFDLDIEGKQAEKKLPTIPKPGKRRTAPYQNLPMRDYKRFVGRKKELALLEELLAPEARHFVITIDGIGGIGKSALALEVAQQYRQNYSRLAKEERFDAIIWTTAKQSILTSSGIITRSQTLRALDDIYSTIASTLEREDITRARREEQDDIVRHALTEQRTLLLIDNLETVDDEHIMTFIRRVPTPTKVIVTTRHRLNIAYPIRVVGMSQSEALELITDEANLKGAHLSKSQATRLYKRTGGVPLAIVWSVAQMGIKHDQEAVLTRLGQPTTDIAQFCFEGALELIRGTPAHKLLMALPLFATDASREALGDVADLPILDRDEGLEELERLSLVNKEGGRFALLPLTKAYSESELAKERVLSEKFSERWIAYFFKFLREQKKSEYQSLDIVNPEMPNILSVIDWCWEKNQLNHVIELVLKVSFYLWITGKWEIWENLLQKGLNATYIYPSELPKASFLKDIAELKIFHEEINTAIDYTLQAIDIFRRHNDNYGLAHSLWLLSVIHFQQNEIKKARDSLNQALSLATRTNNNRIISRIKRYLAIIHLAEGNLDLAELMLHQAKEIREKETKFSSGLSHILILLGNISLLKHNHKLARQYLQKSLEMAKQMGSQRHFSETKQSLARLELALGNSEKATQSAHEALEGFTKLGMKREIRETQALEGKITAQSE